MIELTIDDLVFIGVKGTVLALDRATGQEVWRQKLKGYNFTNLVREGNVVLAATRGELFCLDAADGSVRWSNPLTGLGFGLITIAGATQVAAIARRRADDDSAAATNPAFSQGAVTT
jgi:outer membrane protein assembly factor BamB